MSKKVYIPITYIFFQVWVGQLGSWCSRELLWKEFDRFGAIKDIEYRTGDTQAHVYYENIDAAQAAVQEMRGHPLGGPEKRLRIDFADLDVVPGARRDYEHIDSKHTVNLLMYLFSFSQIF